MREFHTIIIGAGSGGLTAAVGLAGFGKNVAVIERKEVGGDCTNVGCIPSKMLIHLSRQLPANGMSPAEALAAVRQRRNALREEETTEVESARGITLIRGSASFTSPHTIEVSTPSGSEQLRAHNLIIATGAGPVVIPIEGLPAERTLTNESIFDLEDLPRHLAIIGAGIVGSEMAFAFRRLGSEVTVIDLAPRVLPILEPEVSKLMQARLEALGIRVFVNAKASYYREDTLCLDQQGEKIPVRNVDKVLIAIGRRPNLDGLNLEKAGVVFEKRGIPTNSFGRTNVPHIYAIGDINLTSAFTHSANAQGRRLVQKIALPLIPVGQEPDYPSATFTDPEVAQVGPHLEELRRRYHPELIASYRVELKDTDRGYTQWLEHGFVLIHALRLTGRVLSATIVAPEASEMIPVLTLALNRRMTMYRLANLVFPFPTLSEAIKKAASDFVFETLPKLPRELGRYARYRLARPG